MTATLIGLGNASTQPRYSKSKPTNAGLRLNLKILFVTSSVFWLRLNPVRQLFRMVSLCSYSPAKSGLLWVLAFGDYLSMVCKTNYWSLFWFDLYTTHNSFFLYSCFRQNSSATAYRTTQPVPTGYTHRADDHDLMIMEKVRASHKSRLAGFSRKSFKLMVTTPCSSRLSLVLFCTTIIFLNESFVASKGRFSCKCF